MITRIICGRCGDVLRPGQAGAPIEKKICTKCVVETAPAADPNKIKLPPGTKELFEDLHKKYGTFPEPKPIEMESYFGWNNNELLWILELMQDGKVILELGFSKSQLELTLNEMKDIESKKLPEEPK